MAADIPEILTLFKEQLNNQISTIVEEQGFETTGYGFAYWYFRNIRTKTDLESKEQICDGGGDLGIDAIEIADEQVIFYQFKNPIAIDKGIAAGDIDKLLSGLDLILSRQHAGIANEELLSRLQEVYSFTPAGYQIIICSSSLPHLPPDAQVKLNAFCSKHSGAAKELFRWRFSSLQDIHTRFYSVNLPTLNATLTIPLSRAPYMTKIGDHETYIFDLSGKYIAELYEQHGEAILQQNVRMFEGDRSTNLAIAETAASETSSRDFFHFNNGISVICDSAQYQPFNSQLTLERPQVVNGGQTMRILHRCFQDGRLRPEVHAAVRVITTGKDKEFASNVAVNLNNQTRVDNTFLRSNDPRIVQLFHALSTLGYFLERRAGEINAMLPDDMRMLEDRYGSPLSDRVIPLKEGMQAYVATFYGDPQLAKKDPAKIFTDEGGQFTAVLQSDLTAEKFLQAYQLNQLVARQIDRFKRLKRKRYASDFERKQSYITQIGTVIEPVFSELDEAVPQMTMFATALLFSKTKTQSPDASLQQLLERVRVDASPIWEAIVELIRARTHLKLEKSWPTLLKSGSFFREVAQLRCGTS